MMRRLWILLLVGLSVGCAMATSNPRFTHERVPVSKRCYLAIIRDLRTEVCLVAYRCGGWDGGASSVTVVPKEVCNP